MSWKLRSEEVFAGSKGHIEQPSTDSDRGTKGANVFREWQVFKTQVGRRVFQKTGQEKLAYVSKSLGYSASWF